MPRAGFVSPRGDPGRILEGVGSGGWRRQDMSEDPGGASRGRHASGGGEAADDAPTPPSGTPTPGEPGTAGTTGSTPTVATDQPWWNADAGTSGETAGGADDTPEAAAAPDE